MVAQLHTVHSLLLVDYLHRIGRRGTSGLRHLSTLQIGAEETAEHLVLHCPAHDQAPLPNRPKMAVELPGEERGSDPSPTPQTRNERVN